jgi:hypothetical protein
MLGHTEVASQGLFKRSVQRGVEIGGVMICQMKKHPVFFRYSSLPVIYLMTAT